MKKMKRFQAIFFDWDGTAVVSRTVPAEDVVDAMRPLLEQGVRLCIISGTTYENIASGKLHVFLTKSSRKIYSWGWRAVQSIIILKKEDLFRLACNPKI